MKENEENAYEIIFKNGSCGDVGGWADNIGQIEKDREDQALSGGLRGEGPVHRCATGGVSGACRAAAKENTHL